jgi:hypothetical protein
MEREEREAREKKEREERDLREAKERAAMLETLAEMMSDNWLDTTKMVEVKDVDTRQRVLGDKPIPSLKTSLHLAHGLKEAERETAKTNLHHGRCEEAERETAKTNLHHGRCDGSGFEEISENWLDTTKMVEVKDVVTRQKLLGDKPIPSLKKSHGFQAGQKSKGSVLGRKEKKGRGHVVGPVGKVRKEGQWTKKANQRIHMVGPLLLKVFGLEEQELLNKDHVRQHCRPPDGVIRRAEKRELW